MNNELYLKIKDILTDSLHVEENEISPEKELVNDLGINSLELADIVLCCEDTFGVEVDDNAIGKFRTVGDVVDYLDKNL